MPYVIIHVDWDRDVYLVGSFATREEADEIADLCQEFDNANGSSYEVCEIPPFGTIVRNDMVAELMKAKAGTRA